MIQGPSALNGQVVHSLPECDDTWLHSGVIRVYCAAQTCMEPSDIDDRMTDVSLGASVVNVPADAELDHIDTSMGPFLELAMWLHVCLQYVINLGHEPRSIFELTALMTDI